MELKQTNLKSLGLIQGRAAMKLLVKPINASHEQAHVEALNLKQLSKESEIKTNDDVSHQIPSKEVAKTPTPVPQSKPSVESKQSTTVETHPNNSIQTNESKAEDSNEVSEQKVEDIEEMEISSSESSDESQEEVLNYLGGNNSEVIFKMSDLPKVSKKDFPDDFYKTTEADLRHILTDLRTQQGKNTEKALETKQMREQKRKEQMNKYKSTVIRICFPNDKLVFQAIFKPTDTVEDVKQVIRRYISSEDDFYLYTVPPKCELKSESSLFDSDLVPAAVIHFGLNSSDGQKNVIKEEFKSKLSSYKSAAKIANEARSDQKPTSQTGSNTSGHTQTQINNLGRQASGQQKSKVPKWLKTNK